MFDYMGWDEVTESIYSGLEQTIQSKKITYDFHRLMENATLLKTSEFADAIISNIIFSNIINHFHMKENNYFANLEKSVRASCHIETELFEQFEVKRGLRNKDGTGVLVGLTNIGDVVGYKKEDGKVVAIPGKTLIQGN